MFDPVVKLSLAFWSKIGYAKQGFQFAVPGAPRVLSLCPKEPATLAAPPPPPYVH